MTHERQGAGVSTVVLLAALLAVAANLRPALTSVGPLIDLIRQDLGLSATVAGLLNSLPLFAFAAFSPLAHFANRVGIERALMVAMLALRHSARGNNASAAGRAQNASALSQPPGRMRASGTDTPEPIAAVSPSMIA